MPKSPMNRPEPQLPAFTGPPDQRPSAEEWEVLWNPAPPTTDEDMFGERDQTVEWDDAWPTKEEAEAWLAEYTLVYSTPPPLPYEIGKEFDSDENVKDSLLKEIPAYLESAKIPQFDEYGNKYFDHEPFSFRGEVSGHFEPIDRTIEIPLLNPDIFTPGTVRHIQTTVLQKYPLWRIHVVATNRDGERSLTIYPDLVRVGDTLSPPSDFDTTITSWQQDIRRIREPRDGPKRRQALYVRRLLPEVLPTVPRNGAVLIAVFDNCQGDYQTTNAWVAYDKAYEDGKKPLYEDELDRPYSKDVNPVPPYRPGAIGEFYSDVEGNINGDVTSHLPYEIGQCLLPPDEEVMLTIRHKKSGSAQQFNIRRSDAINDDELKRLLGEE